MTYPADIPITDAVRRVAMINQARDAGDLQSLYPEELRGALEALAADQQVTLSDGPPCGGCEQCDGTGRWCRMVRLSPAERDTLSTLLRERSRAYAARLQAGDPVAVREALLKAGDPLDQLANRIDGPELTHTTEGI